MGDLIVGPDLFLDKNIAINLGHQKEAANSMLKSREEFSIASKAAQELKTIRKAFNFSSNKQAISLCLCFLF